MNRFLGRVFVSRRKKEVGQFRKLHVEEILLSPAIHKILSQSNVE
jgi:hypothetical protein